MTSAPEVPIALDPLAASTGGTWSRAALLELVAGRAVLMRDRMNENVALPPWLAEAAGEAADSTSGWSDGVNTIHPLDRADVASAWWDALRRPGTVARCTFRSRTSGLLRSYDD